jgi:hypothetical protein
MFLLIAGHAWLLRVQIGAFYALEALILMHTMMAVM